VEDFERVKAALIRDTDKVVTYDKREFLNKAGFTKLSMAFGISTEIVDQRIDYDGDGNIVGAWAKVRAIAANGRFAEGAGYNSILEPRYTRTRDDDRNPPRYRRGDPVPGSREKVMHDLPATAVTRARNIALGALFPGNVVSWEEVDAGSGYHPIEPEEEPTRAASGGQQTYAKASPYKPASANQLATIAKLSRLLGHPEEPDADMTSAEASERITQLSAEYNSRKNAPKGASGNGKSDVSRTNGESRTQPSAEAAGDQEPLL
jgi:hypothetical protein